MEALKLGTQDEQALDLGGSLLGVNAALLSSSWRLLGASVKRLALLAVLVLLPFRSSDPGPFS
jgi:hypothetical protein